MSQLPEVPTERPHLSKAGQAFKDQFIANIPTCSECEGAPSALVVRMARNGSTQNRAECVECDKLLVFGINQTNIPNLLIWHAQDFRMEIEWAQDVLLIDQTKTDRKCAYGDLSPNQCHARDLEYHHFAPKALFLDHELWPKKWLCRDHHQEWHSVTTPGLVHDYGEHYSWNWQTGKLSRYSHDVLVSTDDDDREIASHVALLMDMRDRLIIETREKYLKEADEELFGYWDEEHGQVPGIIDVFDEEICVDREPILKADFKYNYDKEMYLVDET